MPDDGDFIFEDKREISKDLALANGGVLSVLRGLKTPSALSVSFLRTGSFSWNGATSNRMHFNFGELPVSRPFGNAASFSAHALNRVFSVFGAFPQTGNIAASGMIRFISGPARDNASNGEALTVKERDTPVFSGLFANRRNDGGAHNRKEAFAGSAGCISIVPQDTAEAKTVSTGSEPVISVFRQIEPGGDGPGTVVPSTSRRAVSRSLTLSAEDMAGFRSFQIGGEPAYSEIQDRESGSVVYHSEKTFNGCPPSGESGLSEPADGNGSGDAIVIDDPGCHSGGWGWIAIPERPIGGWIAIPERPIGGWIVEPLPFQKYDVFEDYGVELSSDWTEYTDSDFSKVDLEYASKLSFSVSATNAATFTIYRCVLDENGGYALKALQTTALSYDAESGNYVATTRAVLLDAGQYCIYVQSADPAGEGDPAASYRFELNREDSDMFVDGDNSDDWTDLATEGEFGEVAFAGALDDCSFDVLSDWVGFGDEIDYAGFTLNSAAKLSFSLNATDATKFTIYKLVQDRNGKYSLKTLQTTTLKYDGEFEEYEANTKALLLEAGDYYFSMQSINAAKGGSADYDIYLNTDEDGCEFFTEGDSSDDWTDLETNGPSGMVFDAGVIDENSFDLRTDWVGFGDEIDYAKFSLNAAAKLSFSLNADGAAKFTIYKLVQDKNGKYSLKTLQTTSLSYDKDFELYEANTKALLLEAGEYCFSVQSPDAAKGGGAGYDVYLNWDENGTEFFTQGNNGDDWTDLKTEGENGSVDYFGLVDEYSVSLHSDWVGFGDTVDYMGFTLDTDAKLSFSLDADGATKFTIWQLVRDKNGTYSLKSLQTTSLAYDKECEMYAAATKSLYLAKGDYYISMQSTDAAKGGGANYNVSVNGEDSVFFRKEDDCDDWYDLEILGPDGSVGDLGAVDEFTEELTEGQLAGKDEDYARISLYNAAKLSFVLNADNAAKFSVWQLVRGKNGKYSLSELQATSLAFNKRTQEYDASTKALLLEAGDYYISVKSASSEGVNYRIGLNGDGSAFYAEGCSWDDWTDLKTAGADGEVGYVGAIDECSGEVLSDWVGFGDSTDYMGFTLLNAAKLSFLIDATDAASFTVYQLVQDKRGVFSLKTLQTTTLTFNKATGEYDATTKALLLEAGDYYFSVQSTNAAQGGSAYYTVNFNADASAFYAEGDNSDDWTDLKTEGPFGMVGDIGAIDEYSNELASGWVGFGDAADYMRFSLFSAAKLSFSLDATDAASFTVFQLVQDKNGSYSLKTLQTTSLAFNKATGEYDATTKALLLEAGEYYVSMQSTNAAQGGGAYYNVSLVGDASAFYTEADNSDDWTDVKTEGPFGMVGDIGVIDEYSSELASGWVGFGDEWDYAAFALFDDAELSFTLESTGATTFAIYSLAEAGNGSFKLKTLQSSALVWNKQLQKYTVNTNALKLDAGDYYFSVQSTDAARGGGAYYTLSLNESSQFFPLEDDGGNWGAIDYEPSYDPICRVDPVEPEPVWTVICGYPPCDGPVAVEPVVIDDVIASADVFAFAGVADSSLIDLSENKADHALKELSSIA